MISECIRKRGWFKLLSIFPFKFTLKCINYKRKAVNYCCDTVYKQMLQIERMLFIFTDIILKLSFPVKLNAHLFKLTIILNWTALTILFVTSFNITHKLLMPILISIVHCTIASIGRKQTTTYWILFNKSIAIDFECPNRLSYWNTNYFSMIHKKMMNAYKNTSSIVKNMQFPTRLFWLRCWRGF